MNLIANLIKYGQIVAANLIIDQRNHGQKKNAIKMHSIHNEGKSVVAERFIRTLKNRIYKYMTSVSKNVYIYKLDEIKLIETATKMKPFDVNPSMYIDFNKENNKEGPKLEVGNLVRISKYKNIFAKGYVPN